MRLGKIFITMTLTTLLLFTALTTATLSHSSPPTLPNNNFTATKVGEGRITAVSGWTPYPTGLTWDQVLKEDGNCPGGGNYISFNNLAANPYVQGTASYLVRGALHKFSVWYNANKDGARIKLEIVGKDGTTNLDAYSPIVDFKRTTTGAPTMDTWKKYTILFTYPENATSDDPDRVRVLLRCITTTGENDYIMFANPTIELADVAEKTVGFYDPSYSSALYSHSTHTATIVNLGVEAAELKQNSDIAVRCFIPAAERPAKINIISVLSSTGEGGSKVIEDIVVEEAQYIERPSEHVGAYDIGYKSTVPIGALDEQKTYTLESFIWNSMDTMQPIFEKTTFSEVVE